MGSHFLNKSTLNLDAAEILTKNPNYHYASSIHSAYYSCHQKLAHILYKILAYTPDKFNAEYSQFRLKNNGGSHDFLISVVYGTMKQNKEDAKIFKNDILELKGLRTDSDYKDMSIEKSTSDLAIKLANSVSKVLSKNFNFN